MIELLAAGALMLTPGISTENLATCGLIGGECASRLLVDAPPCPKPGERPSDGACTPWTIRQHYHLQHIAGWPRQGEACDPAKPAPAGYQCSDDDAGKPPPGLAW